jgi:hypothetical protein
MIPVRLPACALARGPARRIGDMSFRLHNIDPIGLAMDWLETCKRKQAIDLAELYSETAVFEYECERFGKLVGRDRIMEYWEPKFALPPLRPFKLEQIWPDTSGVALVYRYMDQSPVRISFQFDTAGKIERSHCRPEPSLPLATAFRLDPWPGGAPQTPTGKRHRT